MRAILSRVCALPAFWTGILYDDDVLDYISNLVSKWDINDVKKLYHDVRVRGFKTITPDGETLLNFSKKMIDLSSKGLRKRNIWKSGKNEESFKNGEFRIRSKS